MNHDPLKNPRPIWRMHYDHRTYVGRYARFLCRILRLQTSGERYMDDMRRDAAKRMAQIAKEALE